MLCAISSARARQWCLQYKSVDANGQITEAGILCVWLIN